ncbi:MAG TPA: CocE/NonD family hydrolase [Solirubrobacteraceae bacterium]|nr:CocE/NonD family hydrolase [Solirubrobacteraceae bacterium]
MRPLLLTVLALLLVAAPASAADVPDGYAYHDEWFEAHDGTQLHAGVFLPADRRPGERHPVVVVLGPYTAPNGGATGAAAGGPNVDGVPPIRFPELFADANILEDRWAYVQVDVRGFGGSGGCFEYYGPNEMRDAGTAVEYLAGRDWSTGKVAMWGKSYDAAEGVLALAARPRGLAAVVTQAPGLSAYTALWMNRVHYATGRYATTGLYTTDDLLPPQNLDTLASAEYAMATISGLSQPPQCRADALVGMNTQRDRDAEFWEGREPYLLAKGSTVPTLWTHGFYDANTKPVHLDVWEALRGPKEAWFGQFTHFRGHEPEVGRRGFLEQAMRFLDRHVRGVRVRERDPAITVQEGNGDGRWRLEERWPPRDARDWSFPVREGSYVDEPGNEADGGPGAGVWSVTRPLPWEAHLAGEPVLRATVESSAPDVNVVAHLYDVAPDGTTTFVQRGALSPAESGEQEVRFALYPQDWRFERGHRIALRLSASEDSWFTPGITGTEVQVLGGSMTLPMLGAKRKRFVAGGPSDGMSDTRPFTLPAGTIEESEVDGPPPPKQRGKAKR